MSSWKPKDDAALRAALAKRMTATQAAAHLTIVLHRKITRSAVIGRAHRTGIAIDGSHGNNTRTRSNTSKVKRLSGAKAASQKRAEKAKARPAPATSPRAEQEIVDTSLQRIGVMELRESTCRWPIGDPRENTFGFCGDTKPADDCPYCARHARIAYAPIAERRRHDAFVRKGTGGAL